MQKTNLYCVVPENIHTPPWKVTGNSEGEGVQGQKFPRGVGGPREAPFPEGEETRKN